MMSELLAGAAGLIVGVLGALSQTVRSSTKRSAPASQTPPQPPSSVRAIAPDFRRLAQVMSQDFSATIPPPADPFDARAVETFVHDCVAAAQTDSRRKAHQLLTAQAEAVLMALRLNDVESARTRHERLIELIGKLKS